MRTVVFLLALAGCGEVPITSSVQIDVAISRSDFATACKGLTVEDEAIRLYTADQLLSWGESPEANACVCAVLHDAATGKSDLALAKKLAGKKRDDLAVCLGEALGDKRTEGRGDLAKALAAIGAPKGSEILASGLKSDEALVRSASVVGLGGSEPHAAAIVELAQRDPDASVRAAAAGVLYRWKGNEALATGLVAVAKDADPTVRSAVGRSLLGVERPEADAAWCALLEDPDAAVRLEAVKASENVRRESVSTCLGALLSRDEPNADVRQMAIYELTVMRTKYAGRALCDAIGPYTARYVVDAIPVPEGPLDIAYAQNAVDFETSFACYEAAMKAPGLSCGGKFYLTYWSNAMGGKRTAPKCPGLEIPGAMAPEAPAPPAQ